MSRWAAWWRARLALPVLQCRALLRGPWRHRRLRRCPADAVGTVRLETADGPVAATMSLPDGSEPAPALIFVHGSHGPLGIYRLLAEQLTRRGVAVFVVDLPGFGRSPTPAQPWRVDQFTGQEPLRAAFEFLVRHPRIDPTRISVSGHSLGGGVALTAALAEPRVHTAIALGPARRVEERTLGPAAREGLRWRVRFALARGLRPWPSLEFVRDVSRAIALECQQDAWRRPNHPPLLLIDGGYESSEDRRFLGELAGRLSDPAAHCTIPEADHYLNAASFGSWVSYDHRALQTCVELIVRWIETHSPRIASMGIAAQRSGVEAQGSGPAWVVQREHGAIAPSPEPRVDRGFGTRSGGATRRGRAGVVFCVLAFAYGYFLYSGVNYNINSRLGLIFALVEEGRLTIDSYHDRPGTYTEDKAFYDGHYYSDKAIGTALLGALVYAPLRASLQRLGVQPRAHHLAYLLNLFLTVLPAAFMGSLIYRFCERLSGDPWRAYVATAAIALGTMCFPFSIVLFGHVLVASMLFGAFALIALMPRDPRARTALRRFSVGLLLGLALITEYTTALIVAGLLGYGLHALRDERPWRRPGWLIAPAIGGLIPIALQLASNAICFGGPFANAYTYFAREDIRQGMRQAMMGIGWPRADVLYYITVHPVRGVFAQSPVLLASLVGVWHLVRSRRWRAEGWLAAFALCGMLALNAGYVWWSGGASFGPRYLIPMLPFLAVPLLAVPRRWFPAVTALAAASVAHMLVITAYNPLIWTTLIRNFERGQGPASLPFFGHSPIYDEALKGLLAGTWMPNAGLALGLHGPMSLVPLLAVLGAVTVWFARRAAPIPCAADAGEQPA